MAAQGQNLDRVALTMFLSGIGIVVPLLLVSLISRSALLRWRSRVSSAGTDIKRMLGGLLIVFRLLTISGLDRKLQAALVGLSPDWHTNLAVFY